MSKFYAISTNNEFTVETYDTKREAAQGLIDSLNGDYEKNFWIDDGDNLCENPHSMLDFSLDIYESKQEAIAYLDGMDGVDEDDDEEDKEFYQEMLSKIENA